MMIDKDYHAVQGYNREPPSAGTERDVLTQAEVDFLPIKMGMIETDWEAIEQWLPDTPADHLYKKDTLWNMTLWYQYCEAAMNGETKV